MADIGYTKHPGGYRAELGDFTGMGLTKKAAKEALIDAISDFRQLTPRVRLDGRGAPWVLYNHPYGWAYCTPTGCTCTFAARDVNAALDIMNGHMDDYCI